MTVLPGALPARSGDVPPCCSHPLPTAPGGLDTNILMPKGKGEGQTPQRALTKAKPGFPVQRSHLRVSRTDPSASWRGNRLPIMHNSLGGRDICDQVMTTWACVSGCSVVSDSSVTPCTVAHQAPLSMGFPRQEYWRGLPSASPGALPDSGLEPVSIVSPAPVVRSSPDHKPSKSSPNLHGRCEQRGPRLHLRLTEFNKFVQSVCL